jgi:hypothetical protein
MKYAPEPTAPFKKVRREEFARAKSMEHSSNLAFITKAGPLHRVTKRNIEK